MTSPVRYGAGGNEETKLTRQSRNALSESNSNLYPIGWVRTLQPLEDTSCGGGWANQPYNASAVVNQYYTQTQELWAEVKRNKVLKEKNASRTLSTDYDASSRSTAYADKVVQYM